MNNLIDRFVRIKNLPRDKHKRHNRWFISHKYKCTYICALIQILLLSILHFFSQRDHCKQNPQIWLNNLFITHTHNDDYIFWWQELKFVFRINLSFICFLNVIILIKMIFLLNTEFLLYGRNYWILRNL